MGREIKRAMDHWAFEGKSNIAVIYRRESLRVGQSLSKSRGAQPVNRACLRRASLPSSGWLLSLSQLQQLFWEKFLVCTIQKKAFCHSSQSYIFNYYWCSVEDVLVQCFPASGSWHLELPMQEHLINIISSENFNLGWKRPISQSGPLQCSNVS